MTAAPPKKKFALSGLRRPTRSSGEEPLASLLFDALDKAAATEPDTVTHGFHSYPARMHPAIASVLLDGVAKPGNHVVDPFCGSGTVLVEARRRGLRATGVDLNPTALRLTEVKTDVRTPASLDAFAARLAHVVIRSKERVKAKVDARAPLTPAQARHYQGHVLKELAGLWTEIHAVDDEHDKDALVMVLSSILLKVQRDPRAASDLGEEAVKRIGRYIPTEMFHKKGDELILRWKALAAAALSGPAPRLILNDARNLAADVKRKKLERADLIITSPPYAGTYNYTQHHELRMPWLGESSRRLVEGEIGARRHTGERGARAGKDRWDTEVLDVLHAIAAVLDARGTAFFVVGDGEVGGQRIVADLQLAELAPRAGLHVVAVASAPRADWKGGADRDEHIVAIRHAGR